MTPPKRLQTATERDLAGIAARRERESAVPEQVWDSDTGRCDGEELRTIREGRSPERRFERIEERLDKIEPSVARMEGKLDTALDFIREGGRTERVRLNSRARIIIAIVGAVGTAIGVAITALAGCV